MKSKIDKYLFDLTDRLAFLNLEEAKLKDFQGVPDDFAVPVFVTDIRALAGGLEGFSTRQIAEAMLYIMGIDRDFKFNPYYEAFLKEVIDKPEAFAVEKAMEKYGLKLYKEALIYLRAAITLKADEIYPLFNYAQAAYEFSMESSDENQANDMYEEAANYYKKVLDLKADEAYANFQLGLMALEKGDRAKAEAHLQLAIKSTDSDLQDKAKTLLQEGQAISNFEEAEDHIERGQYEKAIEILDRVSLQGLPAELKYSILYAKGFSYKAIGKVEEALDFYGGGLNISNQDSLLLADMGMCYALLGEFDQALELYLAALDLEKDSVELLNNIAIIYLNLNSIKKAKEYIGRAKELAPLEEVVDETIRLIRSFEEMQGSVQ